MKKIYENKIEEIRMNLRDEKIWISIDEKTDLRKNAIGHVIVGNLKRTDSKCYLLTSEILEKTNQSTI